MKIFDQKLNRVTVVFKEYALNGATACPECGRPFKEHDVKYLELNGRMRCSKCGAKLKK